ncbi:MAG: sauU 1 [Gammaproteobacteria bacterium]|jgi:MFS family permease|nr:sauU 1 [Gammaproteobacteria bacterium]
MTGQSSTKKHFTAYAFYPVLIVILCAGFLFYKYVLQVSPSIMTHQLMQEFQVNGMGLGNLAATFFYAYFVTQLFVGILLDKYSVRLLSSLAILISALGACLFADTQSLFLAALYRAMMGFGAAFATVCYLKTTAVWFKPNQFAFISGLLATAAMLGAVFGVAPLSFVVQAYGWRNCLMGCGIAGIALSIVFFIVVRDQSFIGPAASRQAKHGIDLKAVGAVLKNKQNWLLTFYSGLSFTPVAVFGGLWGNPFLQESYAISQTQAASLVSLSFLGLAVGGPLLGLLSDRLGKRIQIMLLGNVLALMALGLVIYCSFLPYWLTGILLFVFGFGASAFMLAFAVGKESNPIALAATVIALINSGDGIFGSFSEPLVGKVLDLGWNGKILNGIHYFSVDNYRVALSLLPIYLVLAIVLLIFVRDSRRHFNAVAELEA